MNATSRRPNPKPDETTEHLLMVVSLQDFMGVVDVVREDYPVRKRVVIGRKEREDA